MELLALICYDIGHFQPVLVINALLQARQRLRANMRRDTQIGCVWLGFIGWLLYILLVRYWLVLVIDNYLVNA